MDKLTSMSPEEIMKEREQLLTSLGNEVFFKNSLPSSGYHLTVVTVFKLILQNLHFPEHIITARKRSLGQGNVFTPVCHSVHGGWGGGVSVPGRITGRMIGGGLCPRGTMSGGRGDLCPRGSVARGVSVQGGLCPRRVSVQVPTPPYSHERAVHILLECILVKIEYTAYFHYRSQFDCIFKIETRRNK